MEQLYNFVMVYIQCSYNPSIWVGTRAYLATCAEKYVIVYYNDKLYGTMFPGLDLVSQVFIQLWGKDNVTWDSFLIQVHPPI